MKLQTINIITGLIILFLLIINSVVLADFYPTYSLEVKEFVVPQYGNHSSRNLCGIAYGQNKVYFSNDSAWGELPFRSGNIDVKGGFMAATKGFNIKAVTFANNQSVVFNAVTNSIMAGKTGTYKVDKNIEEAAGLAYLKGHYYLADSYESIIYVIKITGANAKVVDSFDAPYGVRGMAADGRNLYACDSNTIYKYDSTFNIEEAYSSDVSLDGLAVINSETFLATAMGDNKIYLLKY